MNGFSASGNFVNRFAILHPDRVRTVAAGGVNSMPILPLKELQGAKLILRVGISDISNFPEINFNIEEYKGVAQYIYTELSK